MVAWRVQAICVDCGLQDGFLPGSVLKQDAGCTEAGRARSSEFRLATRFNFLLSAGFATTLRSLRRIPLSFARAMAGGWPLTGELCDFRSGTGHGPFCG